MMIYSTISLKLVVIISMVSALLMVQVQSYAPVSRLHMTADPSPMSTSSSSSSLWTSRRGFVSKSIAFTLGSTSTNLLTPTVITPASSSKSVSMGGVANAVGPVKIEIINPTYTASPCPKDKPIPGEKAMKGMRGLCVQVKAELAENSPKELDKAGVYGYVIDGLTSESVLANNPDAGTDAGQFAMIPTIATTDKQIEFEFIAAVPMEKDLSRFENGIGPLEFKSLRVISFPGGQQFGAINPCEMNEFSDECEAWEEENGPYEKGKFMVKSNARTKGR